MSNGGLADVNHLNNPLPFVRAGVTLVLLDKNRAFLDSHNLFSIPIYKNLLNITNSTCRIRADTLLSIVASNQDPSMPLSLQLILKKDGVYRASRLGTMRIPCLESTAINHPISAYEDLGSLDSYDFTKFASPAITFQRHSEVIGMAEPHIHSSIQSFLDMYKYHGVQAGAHFWLIIMADSPTTSVELSPLSSQSGCGQLFSPNILDSHTMSLEELITGQHFPSSPSSDHTHFLLNQSSLIPILDIPPSHSSSSEPGSPISSVNATSIEEICDRLGITHKAKADAESISRTHDLQKLYLNTSAMRDILQKFEFREDDFEKDGDTEVTHFGFTVSRHALLGHFKWVPITFKHKLDLVWAAEAVKKELQWRNPLSHDDRKLEQASKAWAQIQAFFGSIQDPVARGTRSHRQRSAVSSQKQLTLQTVRTYRRKIEPYLS
ncbi:hypothetical protein C8J56DRAFT_1044988 [Mycena floridula]|nr:hypothetical protein C8J56DRAFT_1044988 [Mycena floridula]